MVAGWNDTAAPVPAVTVPELFAAQAARAPDAVAVVCGDAWCQLRGAGGAGGAAGAVAGGAGAGPESVVGLCLERGAELVTAMLGVWLAGAAYLPLDPGYPAERLAFMLADSGRGAGGDRRRRLAGLAGRAGARWWWLDDPAVAAAVAAVPGGGRRRGWRAGQLAYVIYTSGSTGMPKGVAVAHGGRGEPGGGAAGRCWGRGRGRGCCSSRRSVSMRRCWMWRWRWRRAGRWWWRRRRSGRIRGCWRGWSRRAGVTVGQRGAVAAGGAGSGGGAGAGRGCWRGRSCCRRRLAAAWAAGRRLVNTYGPTETTVMATAGPAGGRAAAGRRRSGAPVANTRVYRAGRVAGPGAGGGGGGAVPGGGAAGAGVCWAGRG